jgi:hypothetical protein
MQKASRDAVAARFKESVVFPAEILGEGGCKPVHRIAAGPHRCVLPDLFSGLIVFLVEQGQQPGPDDRRFSAAGASHDRDEMVVSQQPVERKGLVFAPEKELMIAR